MPTSLLPTSTLGSILLSLFVQCPGAASAQPIGNIHASQPQSKSRLYERDDDDGYTEQAQDWCNGNPSECKAVVSTLSIAGLFLILFLAFKWYRRRRSRQSKAKEALAESQAKEQKDQFEKQVEQKFFHRQREIKLRHEMEMLGLSEGTGTSK
ncbi:hypothetical protein B9479_005233 [Cryptococcus floricola]|uniref:Uncharacterized protein n=1 Tax=Cryptococcus floricola TaxID=2591691 RepID=A0A5D3ART7_9TREE|nr:hypothetical protein B9479_005233 [Cryptococcus floricola]